MHPKQQPKSRTRQPPQKLEKQSANEEEVLREQSMTETERHPYLDTEGGE
jgi:hypothetical protein